MNEQQIKAKAERLHKELDETRRELQEARARLEAATGDPRQDEAAEKIAGRVMVLETRERATVAAIEANERAARQHDELLKSKEYRDAQKRITELEKFLEVEADEIFNEMTLLRERVQTAMAKHGEFVQLVNHYCFDMDRPARDAKTHSRDYKYLAAMFMMLTQRHETEKRIEAMDNITAERIAARNTPKPQPAAPVMEKVKQTFYRYTDSKGKPQLDPKGNPLG
jgi:hypothetical protein